MLSSPMPFVQLPRLKRLYLDLYEAIEPLFPPNNRILVTLTAPPPPTSSPLLSTVNLLKEILISLRERSAPIRDERIDKLLSTISLPPVTVQHSNTASSEKQLPRNSELQISPLAQFVIDNFRDVLSLVEDMKSDLNNFILGSMTEDQLLDVLSTEVVSREREFVLNLWDGKEEIRDLWLSWSKETFRQNKIFELANFRWIDRLFKALEADTPVFCVPAKHMSTMQNGTTPPITNNLPPQFFFVIPALVYLQNYLQAIIISAALLILARPPHSTIKSLVVPSSSLHSKDADLGRDFVHRIWTLLKAEIDEDSIDNVSFDDKPTTPSIHIPETKVVNLADEVVHARRALSGGTLSIDEEKRLRDTVDRTLRSSDPVFLVLRKRLFDALEGRLLDAMGKVPEDAGSSTKPVIPERMQTGRLLWTGQHKQVVGNAVTSRSGLRLKALLDGVQGAKMSVVGFEHDVLRNAVSAAYEKLARCVVWTENVWGHDWKNEYS